MGRGNTLQTKSVKRSKSCFLIVPKRTICALDRHKLDIPVWNKSGDLYCQEIIQELNLGVGS